MKKEIIEIKEEVEIGDVVLEEGDRIRVLSEGRYGVDVTIKSNSIGGYDIINADKPMEEISLDEVEAMEFFENLNYTQEEIKQAIEEGFYLEDAIGLDMWNEALSIYEN